MKTKIALLGVLALVVLVWFLRGAPSPLALATQRLGAPSATIATAYQTEHDWAIREISADISEMARDGSSSANAPAVAETMVPWHPDLLVPYATGQLGSVSNATANEIDPADQYGTLLDASPGSILTASGVVSASLKRDMRNPRAHEAAAMVLGAFGLRDSAGNLSDTRWVLNRMTAHLAVAQALRRGQSPPSIDGQIANATLLALAGRQKTSLSAVDALPPDVPAVQTWQRALRMRLTSDWRAIDAPATATRLEKLEYFRARRYTRPHTRAGQDLIDLDEPNAVDFARIVQSRSMIVEDGNEFALNGLSGELDELAHVYQQLHQRELPANLPAEIINARAGRLLTSGDPQVVPWGAWAELAQRHIGQAIVAADNQYRRMLGSPHDADELKRDLDAKLGHLTLYPVASTHRTKGQHGTEADLSQIAKAIDVGVSAPELISYNLWSFIENGSNYEPVARTMPKGKSWFMLPSADVPYDIRLRAESTIGHLKPDAVEALLDEAPFSINLLSRAAERFKTNPQLMEKIRVLLEPRVAFDGWAIESAISVTRDADTRIALRREACELSVNQCLGLAEELSTKDEAAAAAVYERAFRDPAIDAVAMTRSSGWLVQYYERTNQPAKALELAERSAAVGSGSGMMTLARLHERRSEIDEADALFTANARGYQHKAPLAAFLYRQAVVAKKPEYLDRWRAIEREVFPRGLQSMAAEMKTQPATGAFVEQDSEQSKHAGLRAGDIIVGIDGWKIENFEQFDAVLWLEPAAKTHKFTAWRGQLFTVELSTIHGMTVKTHPLKGWIE